MTLKTFLAIRTDMTGICGKLYWNLSTR